MNFLASNTLGLSPQSLRDHAQPRHRPHAQRLRGGRAALQGRAARLALIWALAPAIVVLRQVPFLSAQSASVAYTVFLSIPEQHLVQVQILLPPGPADRELQLPVWNALYQIRDFAQYVNWIRAKDRAGHALVLRKLTNSRWQIEGAANGAVIEYQLFADSPGPFGAQLNTHHAFFNLAEILMYPVDARNSPITLQFSQLPSEWRVAMPFQARDIYFQVENYDRLVDSPVEIGEFKEKDFDEAGGHFRVIIDADPADYDADKIIAVLHKIVAAEIAWMNDRPFETYTFFYHFPRGPAGGGMEHAYSTAIDLSAESIKHNLDTLTGVTAHEFFHLWNVKRIRPQSLEPPDYAHENFTRALWFCEGVTSTVGDYTLVEAGLMSESQYLSRLSGVISGLQRQPAHLTQSAAESSLDAWLEKYPYYRTPQRSISYYEKGELLGVILDLQLRELTHGTKSLRDLFQWMNQNYVRQGRFYPDSDGVRLAAEALSGSDFKDFFEKYVSGTGEIPWDNFFAWVGLRVIKSEITFGDPGFAAVRRFDLPLTVVEVNSGS